MRGWLKLLVAIVIIAIAFLAAPYISDHRGYFLVSIGHWVAEGTLYGLVLTIVLTVFALYAVFKIIQYVFLMLIWPSKWWQKFHANTHANFYQNGLNLMALSQWHLAAEEFLKVRRHERIESARAMALLCATQANDPLLTKTVKDKLNIGETHAELSPAKVPFSQLVLACQQEDYASALTLLDQLSLPVLKQSLPFQQLWLEINIYNHNWQEVDKLLPKIDKLIKKQSSELAYHQWHENLTDWFEKGFSDFVIKHSLNQLTDAWQTMQKHNRHSKPLLFAYLVALAKAQQSERIESILLEQKKLLDNVFILNVLRRYFEINHSVHMDKLFQRVHSQLNKNPEDKDLLSVLGYLAAGQKDHQLARQALEKVIYSQPNTLELKLYAQELGLLGDTQKSLEVYHSISASK
jgi:HemY protein